MAGDKSIKPFGTWGSPLNAMDLASAGIRYGFCRMDGGHLYWSEFRPREGPRSVVVRCGNDGQLVDVLPPPFSARSRVHEYGGGEFSVEDACVVFTNDRDQDLYLIRGDDPPIRLTDANDWRFADMAFDNARSRILAVGERHQGNGGHHMPQNAIIAVPTTGANAATPRLVLAGRDFYAAPRLSPDGGRLAWLAWDLPHMPWEAAELWVAEIGDDGGLSHPRHIAGGNGAGAFQPEWSPEGDLFFVADYNGWGALHIAHITDNGGIRPLLQEVAEFGRPLWQFGMASFATLGDGKIVATCWRDGRLNVGFVDTHAGTWTPIKTGLVRLDSIAGDGSGFAILGGTDVDPPGVHRFSREGKPLDSPAGARNLLQPDQVSVGQMLTIDTPTGPLHALYYPPANDRIKGPDDAAPPLVVSAHGGPTAMAKRGLDLEKQYWTSRGFACLDVDYRGSFGYGRDYVRALDGAWGVLDPEDASTAAREAAAKGLADPDRMVIMGSSAGGLTVLNALAGSDIFSAGASSYGVADLASLATDTHKFEAGYLYALMGAASGDDDTLQKIFGGRSPLTHADKISAPVIFLQGLDDAVVPPGQSQGMAKSLRARGVPVAYLEFEGEGHGFRKPQTVVAALEATHAFFTIILKLQPEDALPPLKIDNFT